MPAGTWPLLRLALRRDRVKLPLWLVGVAGMAAYFASAIQIAYPDEADLVAIAAFMDSPGGTVMSGPGYGWDAPTHATAFAGAYALYLYVAAAFLSVLLVARHTRAEEEAGRLELVRAAAVDRRTPLTVAALLVLGAGVVLGLLAFALVLPAGYGAAGTALFGTSMTAVAWVFGAVALVTAQLAERSRAATGLAALTIGAAVAVRGAGDTLGEKGSALSWLSPIGWVQQTRVFFDDRWWPLLLCLAATVVAVVLASRLQARRDLGAGLLAGRAGAPRAHDRLAGPFALALRLERSAVLSWSLALLVLGLMYGALTDSVESALGDLDNETLLAALGGDAGRLLDGYLATSALFNGYVVIAFALVAGRRLVADERAGVTGLALAAPVGRVRWLVASVGATLVGAAVVAVAGGLGLGGAAALVTGDVALLGRGLAATLVYLPAVAVLLAVAALGYALRPGAYALGWAVAVVAMVVGYLGFALDLPAWLVDASPLSHVPQLPLESFAAVGPAVLLAVGAGLLAVATVAFGRRDLVAG